MKPVPYRGASRAPQLEVLEDRLYPAVEAIEAVPFAPADLTSEDIGSALMVIRVHRRLSQADVARQLTEELAKLPGGGGEEVTQGYISKVETGCTNISLERLALFCKVLECMPHQVMKLAEQVGKLEFRPEREVLVDLLNMTRKGRPRKNGVPPKASKGKTMGRKK